MAAFTVTSHNRGAAKRLLSTWIDSRVVRAMTLEALADNLMQQVNAGMITMQGVQRALAETTTPPPKAAPAKPEPSPSNDDSDSDDDADDEPVVDQASIEELIAAAAKAAQEKRDAAASAAADSKPSTADSDNDDNNSNNNSDDYVTRPEWLQGRDDDNKVIFDTLDQLAAQVGANDATRRDDRKLIDLVASDVNALRERVDAINTPLTVIVKRPDVDDVTVEGTHEMFPLVMKAIAAGQNVALVGPAGTGKSYMTRQIAVALGREYRQCGALSSKYDLIGFVDANGNYHETPVFEAYTQGTIFCFDEFDASAPDAAVAFNGMTDSQPAFAFPNGMQKKHGDFVAVACMNTHGNGATSAYVGRFKQDAAAMDRFVRIVVDYDKGIEQQLGDDDICKRVWSLRAACAELAIQHTVSTRMITRAQDLRNAGWTNKELDQFVFFSGLTDSTIEQLKPRMQTLQGAN